MPRPDAGTQVSAGIDLSADVFAFPNFGATASPEVFGAADVVAMFGDSPEVCASGSGEGCVLAPEAATWARMVNQARQSGHCEGFAVMSAARFMQGASPKTQQLQNQGDVTHGIMRGFATQFIHAVQEETTKWAKKSVAEKVAALAGSLETGKLDHVLGVYTQQGGHAVLPWKVEYLEGDTARIHVYDSNWPGKDRYVTADLGKNAWSFSFSGKDPANDPGMWSGGSSDMDLASMSARESGECPFCKGDARVKSSMFVIRAAAPDWSVTVPAGELSPTSNMVGDDTARPMKASDGNIGYAPGDHLINVTLPAGGSADWRMESPVFMTGLTGGGAVQVQTGGVPTSVSIGATSISSPQPQTVLTFASGGFAATVNGSNSEISSTPEGLTIRTETPSGQQVNVQVNQDAPAVEVRTGSTGGLPDGGYQVLTQTGENEITTKTVSETGRVTETVTQGTIASTGTNVQIPEELAVPEVDPTLPPSEERVMQPAVTTTTSTSTTVPSTTTTSAPPRPTTTVPRTTTTTTSTVAPTTTTSTTVPPTTTTTTLPSSPWTQHLSASANEQHQQVVADSSGNVYTTGYFCSATMTAGSVSLANAGAPDCDGFVQKVSATGSVLWASRFGGTGQDFPTSIAVDGSGNVYVTSNSDTSFAFGSSTVTHTWAGGGQPNYLKFDPSGAPLWGRSIPSVTISYHKVTARGSFVYLVSSLNNSGSNVSIGGVTQALPSPFYQGAVVARLGPSDGVPSWMEFVSSSTGTVVLGDTTTDSSGNVYVAGHHNGSSVTVGGQSLTNAGQSTDDVFLAKWGSDATLAYAKAIGGSGIETVGYVAVDSSQRPWVAFHAESTAVNFGGAQIAPGALGTARIGVVGLTANGSSVTGARFFTAPSGTGLYLGGLGVDAQGTRVYLAGTFQGGAIDLGNGQSLANPGGAANVFYMGYRTSDGVLTLSGDPGGTGNEYMQGGGGVAVDSAGNPFLAFDSWSTVITLGSSTHQNNALDAYLIKSNPSGQWP